jgi:hypothetical protein
MSRARHEGPPASVLGPTEAAVLGDDRCWVGRACRRRS